MRAAPSLEQSGDAMAEPITRLPLSLDEIFAIAAGRPARGTVELTTRYIIEKPHSDSGTTIERAGYLLTAEFSVQIGDESYLVAKPYVFGYEAEIPEVTVANRKIANGRLRRDYRRLHQAGFGIEPRYFEELVAAIS
jgi:hypothetical protein